MIPPPVDSCSVPYKVTAVAEYQPKIGPTTISSKHEGGALEPSLPTDGL